MKKIVFGILISIFFFACGSQEANPDDLSLEEKKTLLKEKRSSLRKLEKEIKSLEDNIGELDPSTKEVRKQLVTTQKVAKKDFETFAEVQGSIQAVNTANATSELGGRLKSVVVKEGDYVRTGALIATTDIESYQKNIAELETSLSLARDLYTRQKNLWDQNIGTEIQLIQAKNQVEQLEKKLETIQVATRKANVYAPISGVVERVNLDAGELAGPGMPIVTIMSMDRVKVVADLTETYLKSIKKGDKVIVKVPALETEQEARVSMIGRMINPANRTFKIEANLNNRNKVLKPNLLATMSIKDFAVKGAVVVPSEMIQQDVSEQYYVYIAKPSGKEMVAKKVIVEIDKSFEGETVVTSGLQGEEDLIMKGSRDVSDGEILKVLNPPVEKIEQKETPKEEKGKTPAN